ncbi:MAG: ATP-binding protein [Pyrinomonadaceae bacterium]|nr:ATP-binding protein [Pyrinomonadaceae bacterium]
MIRGNRINLGLSLLTALFLLATLFAALLFALSPATPAARGPLLLTAFVAILIGSLVFILFLLRWFLRPYRQLVGEAERAPVESRSRKSRDEGEFVLETFQSVVAQLQTQRKELQQLSAQASERADSAVRFSERIIASVPSGLIAFDSNGRSMVINAPGLALLEFEGQALGRPVSILLRNVPQLAQMVEECLQTGKLYRREIIQTVASNGSTRRLGGTIAPIDLSPDRRARGALCLLTDITEVTELREQVALKRNLESLGEMSAGLAHEFKNAIATLHGYAQLMQNLDLDERGQSAASSLLNEVRNLSEMVTSFLNFARPQPLQMEDVSLSELIHECIAELEAVYEELHVEIVVTTESFPKVRADERMLRQALLNLLRNAAEAVPEDKAERKVMLRGLKEVDREGNEWALIEIEDSGEGIPQSDLQRIFIPFFTTKEKGHGIGLALAHRVITEHGGTLIASNKALGGATFTMRLPVRRE